MCLRMVKLFRMTESENFSIWESVKSCNYGKVSSEYWFITLAVPNH